MNNDTRIFGLITLVLLALVSTSCRKSETSNGQTLQPVSIQIEILKPQMLVDAIQVAGTVKAYEDVNMSPEEGGILSEWKVVKGQRVNKGDLVVVLKDDMLKAGWNAADAQYKMAELNLEAQRKVYEEHGISDLQFKNLQYARDAAQANAELMKARWEHTQLRSPIEGIVDNTIPNKGDFVPPGVPIARIVNTSRIKIQAEVPELYAGSIDVGTPSVITFDALPGDTLRGKISFIGSTLSAMNRTLAIELILSNPYQRLKPEMVAKVRLLRETKKDAILVSENIVQLVDRDRSVAYVEYGGKAVERNLKLGGRQGIMIEILEGLKMGDHLIVSGYQKVVDGSPVIVSQ
jgi:membrane fusion protein (multidrug efflux system)